jgi:hypothetical protein
MFSNYTPALKRSYSSQDSQSLKSILEATIQSSYGSHTSLEDFGGHVLSSAETECSQALSVTSDETGCVSISDPFIDLC